MPSSSDEVLKQVGGEVPLLWLSVREGIEAYTRDPDHTDRTRANIIRDKIIARLKANFANVEDVAFQERNNLCVMQIARGRFFVKVKKMNGEDLRTAQQPTQLVLAYKGQDHEYLQPRLLGLGGDRFWADETEAQHLELGYRLPPGGGVELHSATVWLVCPDSISSIAWAICLDEIVEPAVEEIEPQPTVEAPKSEVVAREDLETGEAEEEQQHDERKRRSETDES